MTKLILLFTTAILYKSVVTQTSDFDIKPLLKRLCWVTDRHPEIAPSFDPNSLQIVEITQSENYFHGPISNAAESLSRSPFFRKDLLTVIFVHGWTDGPLYNSSCTISSAYQKLGKHNFLALDAKDLLGGIYFQVIANVKNIGQQLGRFIYNLTEAGSDPDLIHLIGHSLGAHVASVAGKTYKTMKDGKQLPRITGLDPAGPCYNELGSEHRLCSTDAKMVDVIHTNFGVLGMNKSIGTVDFYPNVGMGDNQPGCTNVSCSHDRAWEFYAESLTNPSGFLAVQCDNWTDFVNLNCFYNAHSYMGISTPIRSKGNFYLKTKSTPKYALGRNGV